MRSVWRSSPWTIRSLIAWWIGDSTVHMKRVPMLIASAPSASAATMPRASAKPPDAISGIVSRSAAAGISTRPGTSSSPGCPAQSKSVDRDGIHADALRLERMADRGRLVDHLDPGRPEVLDVLDRVVPGGLDDLHARVDDRLPVLRIGRRFERGKDREVDRERFVGQFAAALDLPDQVLRRRLGQRGDASERACVCDRRDQLGPARPTACRPARSGARSRTPA